MWNFRIFEFSTGYRESMPALGKGNSRHQSIQLRRCAAAPGPKALFVTAKLEPGLDFGA